jgi:hypothetical protein
MGKESNVNLEWGMNKMFNFECLMLNGKSEKGDKSIRLYCVSPGREKQKEIKKWKMKKCKM